MISTASNILIFLGLILTLLLGLVQWNRLRSPHPEVIRKAFHTGGGLLTLVLPFWFDHPEPVWLLGMMIIAGLLVLRSGFRGTEQFSAVLFGVRRRSCGDILFVLSICMVFTLSGGDFILYLIPILILSVADSTAAIVGIYFGRHAYTISGSTKTLEGSTVYFLLAFSCGLLFFWGPGDLDRLSILTASFFLAWVTTLLEGVSGRGWDNLFSPLAAVLMLAGFHSSLGTEIEMALAAILVSIGVFGYVQLQPIRWKHTIPLGVSGRPEAVLKCSKSCRTYRSINGIT